MHDIKQIKEESGYIWLTILGGLVHGLLASLFLGCEAEHHGGMNIWEVKVSYFVVPRN